MDYYVTAAYRDYEKELKDVTLFSLDEEDDSLNEVYRSIADCRRKEECIIPVAISSKSKGTVEVSDLRLDMEVGGAGVITNFYDLELTGDLASYDGVLVFDLIQAIANTPDRVGREYDVHVEINGERSNDVAFETIKLPEPHMRFSDEEVAIGQEVLFDLRDAESDFDDAIVGFDWDFGDGESSSGPIAVHSYSSGGTYVVVASVTDTAGRTGYQARRILVEGEEENETVEPQSFEGKLDKTITEVESMIAGLGSFDAEVVQALGYSQRLNKAHSDLTALKNGSQSPTNVTVNRDMRYNNIIRGLPKDISVQSTTFEGKIKSLDKIPAASALMLEDELGFKNKLFLAQKGLVLTSVAKAVTVKTFAGGTDNFVLIKKTVSGPGEIYELIPTGVNVVQVLTPGHSEIGTNVMKFSGVQEVSYIVESADLMLVTKAKTLVVPSDLSGFEVGSGGFEDMFNCGDGLCESGVEDKHSCPEDCKGGFPWGVVIVMLVVILLGVFYIYFYKGPGSFDDLNSKLKGNKKQFRPGVKRPVGNLALKRYVRGAMAKGIPRNKIIFALKKKGWNEAQIRNAFK